MKILLDTHVFLWWIIDSPKLSARAEAVIRDESNTLFFSAACGWEIAIKTQLGRLHIPQTPERFIPEQLARNGMESLPISITHALHVAKLPALHRDPFDRMLVSQAQIERLPILTIDPLIRQYRVETVW
ncbi:MAG: type II toxin-antitoxin system VapC family toxin [Candidatus Omnitrophica bacterium]|nr:type II toxin-antitoxin system VapC family toxin [Candidatus Omnitrophota bacterium]